MGFVPTQVQQAAPPPVEEELPPPPPPEEQPAASGFVPTQVQQAEAAPQESPPAPVATENSAPPPPPPPGPFTQAVNAVSEQVSEWVPDQIEDPVSGWVPPVTEVTTALGQGDIGGAVAPILDYANRPFEFGAERQGTRAIEGEGQVPSPGDILDDPSKIYDVVPGWWNTSGPGAWAAGSDIDQYVVQNPEEAQAAYEAGGGLGVLEAWKQSGGIQSTPAGVDSPVDDEEYTGSALDRAGQVAGELGEFGGSVLESGKQGTLGPFLRGMVVDVGNDPSVPAQIALAALTGGASLGANAAGRAGMAGVARNLGRVSSTGRAINRAADTALDPITNSIGAIATPATKGVRSVAKSALDYSPDSRRAMSVDKLGEVTGEYLTARTAPAMAPTPPVTPGAAIPTPPPPNGPLAASPGTQPGGVAPSPSNTIFNPPTGPRAVRNLPAGRDDPYTRTITQTPRGVVTPMTGRAMTPSANTPRGPIPRDALSVRGGNWLTESGQRVALNGDIDPTLRATARTIYDEMLTADPSLFWDRFDATHHLADVPLGADGFYARWRAALRQGLYLVDDWPEARAMRQLPGARNPGGGIDWQRVTDMAMAGDTDAKRALAGKRQHDLYVHRIAAAPDPDREVYNLLTTYHLDQASGRFDGTQYGVQYWKQRAEAIGEALRDAGYTPSPTLLQRLANLNLDTLVSAEFPNRTAPASLRNRTLATNGIITLHQPTGRPFAIDSSAMTMPYRGEFGPSITYGDPALYQNARQRLDRLGLTDIALQVVDRLENGHHGEYDPFLKIIRISREISDENLLRGDPTAATYKTVDHEAIHAMRDLGVVTREEWDELVAESYIAKAPKRTRTDKDRTFRERAERTHGRFYGNIDDATYQPLYDEEAVAELFAWWRQGKYVSERSATILGRMYDFLKNLYHFMTGNPEAMRILDGLDSGDIGKRARFSGETRSQQVLDILSRETGGLMRSPVEEPPVNIAPTPNQERVATSFGYLQAHQRQRIVDAMPQDAIMGGDGIPTSLQLEANLAQSVPLKFNDGSTPTGTLRDAIDQVSRELDQWVDMAQDPALQTGRAEREFARLSKKFALDDDGFNPADLAGPQNAWRRDLLTEEVMRAAYENGLPKAAKGTPLPGAEQYNAFMNMRRRVQLYNVLNIPRFMLQQHIGNSIGAVVGGRPGAGLRIFTNLREYRPTFRQLQKPGSVSLLSDDMQRAMGGGNIRNVTQSNRAALSMDPLGHIENAGPISRVLAPDATVNLGKINDTITRSTIYTEELQRGYRKMNKDLPGVVNEWAQRYGLPYSPEQINQTIADFLNQHRVVIDGNTGKPHTTILGRTAKFEPVYSAADLNAWLRQKLPEIAPPTSMVTDDPLGLLVRRVGADTANNIKAIQRVSEDKLNEIAFEWRNLNVDDWLQKFTMYPYWMTRAGGLYMKQMVTHPWALAAYGRMMEDFENQATLLDAPDWMKGWFQFMNTPAGFSIWYSPTDLASTLLTFADWQMDAGESPFDNLTWLGQMRNHIPFMLNPLLDYVAYAVGAYGPDAYAPDLLGVNRPATMATDLLNLANAEGLLPAWVRAAGIGVDAMGNPVPLQPKKLTELYARVGNGISSALKEITGLRPVEIPNTAGSQSRSIAYILEQNMRVTYPGLPQGEIDRKVTEALADPGSPEYQAAWRQQADMPFMTGDIPGVPGAVEGALRLISPVQIYAGTEQQFIDSTMKGLAPSGDIPARNLEDDFANNAAKYGASKTVEGRQLAEKVDDSYNAGDPTITAVDRTSGSIYFGNTKEDVSIGGVTYTPEEIAGFDEETRKALANQYRDEQGVTWEMIEANDATREGYLDANPDVAAYMDWKNAAYDHPGGEEGYIRDLMASNPAYADYMSRNNFDLNTGEVDFEHALTTDAYLASQGIAPTVYEPISSPSMEPLPTPRMPTVHGTVDLELYPGADASLEPIAYADANTPMTLIGMEGDWAHVTIGGQEGYVDAGYLMNSPGGMNPEGLTGAIGGAVHGGMEGIGSLIDATGAVVGTMVGNFTGEGTKPSQGTFTPGAYAVEAAPDGMGVKSTADSDRTWMENMVGNGHAIVTTDYKGATPGPWYAYQIGHGADETTHAAYDISCDTGYAADGSSTCPGTPIFAPMAGTVVCSGYGQGNGQSLAGCTYSQNTTIANPDGSAPAHTVVLDVGQDMNGNPIQLSLSHMGTSNLTPGQTVNPGDLLGGMGDTEGGPHVHVEGWAVCGDTYHIVDPTLVVAGYYASHPVC